MRLWVDIETLPGIYDAPALLELVTARAPKTITKRQSLLDWCATHTEQVWRDTALDPLRGRVLCVAVAVEDEPVRSWYDQDPSTGSVLPGLDAWLGSLRTGRRGWAVTWAGYNVAFDLGFLRLHAARLGLDRITRSMPSKPYDSIDVKAVAQGQTGRRKGYGLADVAAFFGLAKGEGLHRSEVLDAYTRGEHARIERYCRADVELTREIGRRIGA